MNCSRRHFLAQCGVGLGIAPWSRVLGANDRIGIGVIGLRKRGKAHLNYFADLPDAQVVAMCDVDKQILSETALDFEKRHYRAETFTDMRALLNNPRVDAVCIATPNHWHALAAIWACQAGKDVYVEKPLAYNLWEGQQMIAAARKYQRIIQVGTQRRSDEAFQGLVPEIQSGLLGQIQLARVFHYSRRAGIGNPTKPINVPASVDYDLWLGPAKDEPMMRNQFHYDWHWFWNTGNGELGNNGPHGIDLARWVIDQHQLPNRVQSIGGRFRFEDTGETPNTHVVWYDYQPVPLMVEIRNLPSASGKKSSDSFQGVSTGIVIECEEGYLTGMNGFQLRDRSGKIIREISSSRGRGNAHQANFIQAMRTRDVNTLNCDVAEGHLSTALCHLGNISHRMGINTQLSEAMDSFQNQTLISDALSRMNHHLAENGIPRLNRQVAIGPELSIDPERSVFKGERAAEANAMCQREYRQPFAVPTEV